MPAVLPEREDFTACYESGQSQLLWLSLAADLQTPVSVYLRLTGGEPMSYLLESVEGGAKRGRYSYVACRPDLIWRYQNGEVSVNSDALEDLQAFTKTDSSDPLASLKSILQATQLTIPEPLPPMACALGGYLSYDCIRLAEDIPDNNDDVLGLPDGIFMRPSLIAVFDNVTDTLNLVTPVFYDGGISASEAYNVGLERLLSARALLDGKLEAETQHETSPSNLAITSNVSDDEYMAMVKSAQEYIAAGDIFQVVLSRRYCIKPYTLPPFALYRSLRRTNPSPYMFYLNFGDFQVAGSSPEILVQLSQGKVVVRPIAGTRRRGADSSEDAALAKELLSDEKECCEHLMLLDLGRNDVGRVSEVGSVKVTDSFFIEYYSHVMHIVSNVEGDLDSRYDAFAALLAGFPAGTVSGAPKIRAMEIIDELESDKRGIYAGCIGHFSAGGDMNTCIALRTAIIKDGEIFIQAGAGIVADSVPASESRECYQKASAIFKAAELAQRYEGN